MDESTFWQIIAACCAQSSRDSDEWEQTLEAELAKLEPAEIIRFEHIFSKLINRAYTVDLWGAAYLMNGGASDDGFYHFRCWLIGMGRQVYEAAIADPDSLAGWLTQGEYAYSGIYVAPLHAWKVVTGNQTLDDFPLRNENVTLCGEDWDFDDGMQAHRRLPRLAALYVS